MLIRCPYCGRRPMLVSGAVIYGDRLPALKEKHFYLCSPCNAYVGCHPGTTIPMGRLANAPLRAARTAAHDSFDLLWKEGDLKRGKAYAWLAEQLQITAKQCHIGEFDEELCRRTVELCNARHTAECGGRQLFGGCSEEPSSDRM